MPARRSLLAISLCGLTAASLPPAHASSPAAWRDYGRQVQASCLAASTLKGARPLGERVDLPAATGDGSLTSALLLEGRAPQAHRRGSRVLELCLYDQRSRQARVAEADPLLGPRQP